MCEHNDIEVDGVEAWCIDCGEDMSVEYASSFDWDNECKLERELQDVRQ